MNTVLFLILFPVIVALLLLFSRQLAARKVIVLISTIILSAASIFLVVQYFNKTGPIYFEFGAKAIDAGIFILELILAVIIIVISVRHRQFLAGLLMLAGAVLAVWFHVVHGSQVQVVYNLFIDNLSLIMTIIIGVIGSLIALFAVGYMEAYHRHHPEVKNRVPFFFFVIYVFLGAMYGVVFANNLLWLFFFWEITTFCSFFLIGYSRDEIAIKMLFKR